MNTIPFSQRSLAAAGLVLALVALGVEALGGCGSCRRGTSETLVVAVAGTLAYTALLTVALLNRESFFHIGVFVAAAVHTVLVVWMIVKQEACPVCIGAAVAALANAAVALRHGAPLSLVDRVYVPAVLAASGLVFAAIIAEERVAGHSEAKARHAVREAAVAAPAGRLAILVYENDHCPYCLEFRERYEPALNREFGEGVEIRYFNAEGVAWVRRTPTIVVESGPVYEGLPVELATLTRAVSDARARRGR